MWFSQRVLPTYRCRTIVVKFYVEVTLHERRLLTGDLYSGLSEQFFVYQKFVEVYTLLLEY